MMLYQFAVSLALVGNESCAILLRLLVALELALNVDFDTNHPKFTYFPFGGRHLNTIFSLYLTGNSNKVFHREIKIGFWLSGQK